MLRISEFFARLGNSRELCASWATLCYPPLSKLSLNPLYSSSPTNPPLHVMSNPRPSSLFLLVIVRMDYAVELAHYTCYFYQANSPANSSICCNLPILHILSFYLQYCSISIVIYCIIFIVIYFIFLFTIFALFYTKILQYSIVSNILCYITVLYCIFLINNIVLWPVIKF